MSIILNATESMEKGAMQIMLMILILATMCACADEYEATAKTYIFASFSYDQETVEFLGRHFEMIIAHDNKRKWNPVLRNSDVMNWRRDIPLLLVYKDCLTLIGPGNPWGASGDSTAGGGASVGGYSHFDSLFRGLGYDADTQFLMASDASRHRDSEGRIKAGDSEQWQYRWVMDYGKDYWTRFYACSTKIQCLRNYENLLYDNTLFDGVFIDNLLYFNWVYGIYPQRYWNRDDPSRGDLMLRESMYAFLDIVMSEYHDNDSPPDYGRRIIAVGNTNMAWKSAGIWSKCLSLLDGGVEETYFADTTLQVNEWRKIIDEIEYCEEEGKICLVHKALQSVSTSDRDPFSVTWFDTTQMLYGFTSYLMAADSMCFFSFGGDYQHIFWAPILDIEIGKPLGAYEMRTDGLFYRFFEDGLVYCNPTPDSKRVTIPGDKYNMINASGDILTKTSLWLEPYHGAVLKLRN